MLPTLKRLSWTALLAASVQVSLGFSLLGPVNEAYQVDVIGYNLPGDIGAPKNLAQEYRRNTPVLYYTCDANFWDFFGARGVAEVDKAFAVFNALPKASDMSADLHEYPLQSRRTNYRAEALFLYDIKSWVMCLMLEQLGLAEPDRYTWALHNRYLLPNTQCPFGETYLIVKRNFDPFLGTSYDQLKPTSYVNGSLLSYQIIEYCNAPLPPQAWCQPVPVDAEADLYSSVAALFGFNELFLYSPYGAFFQGLTRDDVGGLRYLLSTNNMNVESAGPNTLTLVTNPVPTLLVTSNLTLLAAQSLTNDAPTLQGLFPNLVVLSSSNWFTNVYITNTTPYFTNHPWDPVGTAPQLEFATNVTPTVETRYQHTFGNVLRLIPTPSGWVTRPLVTSPQNNGMSWVTIETTSVAISNNPWAPVGSTLILTNTSYLTYQTNDVVGDYVILPTNMCEIAILASQLTNVLTYTNPIVAATNIGVISTNVGGLTNAGTVLYFAQNYITYFTNHIFVILPVICEQTNVALRQGIEKISFVRRDYDSLLNRFFMPITNEYTLNAVTNNTIIPQKVRRVVTQPDFLFTARDITAGPAQRPYTPAVLRDINFSTNNNNAYPGLAGPGTIEPQTTFTFNNVGPLYYNAGLIDTNAFLTELDQVTEFIWGSFDGTTNVPVIYPNDVSITDMENQVLVQVSPPYLPAGVVGVEYSANLYVQASTSNWQPGPDGPTFELAPGSPGLPPGLQIMRDTNGSGLIYGYPSAEGTYDFVIRVADSLGHNVDRSFAITINPPDGGN